MAEFMNMPQDPGARLGPPTTSYPVDDSLRRMPPQSLSQNIAELLDSVTELSRSARRLCPELAEPDGPPIANSMLGQVEQIAREVQTTRARLAFMQDRIGGPLI